MKHIRFRLFIVFACLAALLTSCSRDPNVRKQKYYESGDRYFAKGQYHEAIIQYRNATNVDSTFAAAHYQLAQSYMKLGDLQHAYVELGRTVELKPDNYKAQVDIANLLVMDGSPDSLKAAQEHVNVLLEKQPNEPESHMTAANILRREQRLSEALAEMQKAITLAPSRGDAYYDLAVLQSQANLPDAAEANFKKAIDLKAPGVNPHFALAAFYQAHSRYADAEQQIQQVIDSDPKNVDARTAMARVYISEGKRAEAESFLKQVKQQFPDNSRGYRMLGDYYFEVIGDLDKAVGEYESLYREHAKDPEVQKNYVQLLILKGRAEEASKLNEAYLKAHPKDEYGLTYRGEIQLAQGKASDAVRTLQSVVTSDPNMAVAHYQLGLALNQTGDMDRAATEWREATRLLPSMIQAQRMLAQYSVQKDDASGLETIASKIIEIEPASPDGYVMRALALTATKQFAGAEQDARKAIQLAPQAAAGYLQMGNLMAKQGQLAQSESWYKQSLSRDKNSSDALRGLLNVYLAQKQTEKAVAAANQQIALSPDNSIFYDLLGSIQMGKPDYPAATVAFKKAVELDKKNADAYLKLGQAQARTGAFDDAIATCNAGLQNNPKEPAFYMILGSVYENKNDLANAKSSYEKVLQLKPDDPMASNNLAYLLLQTNSNPDLALRLAQTAERALPEVSNVADTLGWAFYQKGIYEPAINMFQEAIKLSAKHKEPESATYHYHLGLAYAKAEQPALARQHLERALKIDPKYSDAEGVRKQLAQLKS